MNSDRSAGLASLQTRRRRARRAIGSLAIADGGRFS